MEKPIGFDGVTRVVAQPLRFKAQLRIGEDAYASLSAGRVVGDLWHVGSAAAVGGIAASSSVTAGAFFGSWLTALGVGVAVTPVGWVVGSAAAAGALGWGVLRAWRSYAGSRVEAVPKFINTPIDFLAAALFDMVAGLCVLVSREAGDLDQTERDSISAYFVSEWGLDPAYIAAALPLIEADTQGRSITDTARALAEYKRQNPDCNYDAMSAEILSLLTEIAQADGHLDPAEEAAISEVRKIFAEVGSAGVLSQAGEILSQAGEAISWGPRKLWDMVADAVEAPEAAPKSERLPVPTLWLLGKTGAGKSSLVRAMTGLAEAEVGNGYAPCTRTARSFDFPSDEPVMRFLDTRGLGEVAYDPAADLAEAAKSAHVALILMRLDDPVQGMVTETLAKLRKSKAPVILIHTAGDLLPEPGARARMIANNTQQAETAFGAKLPAIELDLSNPENADLAPLEAALTDVLPSVVLFLMKSAASGDEEVEFARHRALILSYAGSAMASGGVPLVGAVGVTGLQIAMLSALAERYGVDWDTKQITAMGSALGVGLIGGQAARIALRELIQLVPVVGTIAGVAAGATAGFAVTWALGRTAAWWFYQQKHGQEVANTELRSRFADAMKGAGIGRV